MRDEFKSVVPGPATPSRRGPAPAVSTASVSQQHPQPPPSNAQQQQQRRPSDGPPTRGPGAAQPSPRAKLLVRDDPVRAPASTGTSVAASVAAPGSTSHAHPHDEDMSKTFITALAATKQRPRNLHGRRFGGDDDAVLRPPSPLEAADAWRHEHATPSEPMPANYVGDAAMDHFWGMFHLEDVKMNRTLTGGRPESPATALTNRLVEAATTAPGDRPRSARTTYLASVRRMRLTPEPMGIVRRRAGDKGPSSSVSGTTSSSSACSSGSSVQEINLSSYRMGDTYAAAFSESFGLVPGVEVVNLANNRIGDAVGARVVRSILQTPMLQSLQTLNLAHNGLGLGAARALAGLVQASKTLTSLNLSHTRLRDREIGLLCEALQKNSTLARLHLSENQFGIPGMVAIGKFLEENAKIEEVYLAWNNIRGLGALKIVEALKFHASLRALDLSWNSLDSNELLRPRTIVTALADALANNKVLAHLDLANNHLDRDDCVVLARHLESNQTLMGLHMSGNCGVMDTRGFLIPKRAPHQLCDQHKMYSIAAFEEAMGDTGSGTFPSHLAHLVDRFCWYCGQWSEYRFAWHPTAADGPFAGSPSAHEITPTMAVLLHVSHDDWRGHEMERRDDGSFIAYRILPPGKTEYFFTVADRAADHGSGLAGPSFHYIKEKRSTRLVHHVTGTPDPTFGTLPRINVVRNACREGRDPCNTLQPRATGKTIERAARWDINRSVFARRRRESVARSFVDTDGFVQKACGADWRQCKVDRFIKDPARRKEVEACVTRHFRTISGVYRRYCGHNVLTSLAVIAAITPAVALQIQNDVISVPWSGYVEFLSECRILDEASEFCRYADLENVFVAANLELTQEAKEKDNPDRSLTRFEFLEVVIRIAMNKYHRTNVCETPAKAVDKLILEHLVPNCPEDPNEFRTRFLYTEEVSEIFSENIVLLQDIYNSNMGKYCKPAEKKGMQLVEFLNVMDRYQVYSDAFKIRDVKDPFLCCKLVVLDEMATVGHKKLFLTDFMELLLRVSVLRYPPPRSPTIDDVAGSLQKLFVNHFLKHEALLDQFRETVDDAVAQQRIEEFAKAINANSSKKAAPASAKLGAAGGGIAEVDEEEDDGDGSGDADERSDGAAVGQCPDQEESPGERSAETVAKDDDPEIMCSTATATTTTTSSSSNNGNGNSTSDQRIEEASESPASSETPSASRS